jgi:hypothetical protein
MDHLPYPENPALPPLQIPYLCDGVEDDDLQFPHLLTRGTPNDGAAEASTWFDCEPDVAARRAQHWIYFGLLRHIFGSDLLCENFRTTSSTSQGYTISLKSLLMSNPPRSLSKNFVRSQLNNVCEQALLEIQNLGQHSSTLTDLVYISVYFLVWTFSTAFCGNLPSTFRDQNILRFLEARMRSAGWCPHWTRQYCRRYSAVMIHYIAAMSPPGSRTHESCTTQSCVAHSTSTSDYITRHRNPNCVCSLQGPPVEDITAIIRANRIPVIRLTPSKNGQIEVKAFEFVFGKPFVAISHVWSDGLGNPILNALPQCQLRYIFSKLEQIGNTSYYDVDDAIQYWITRGTAEVSNSRYIWMDTLCIPVGAEHADLRRGAINKMAQVYSSAQHVLVLDSSMENTAFEDVSKLTATLRIQTCTWMTRCWTYQEACLARNFYFSLKDRVFNPRRLEMIQYPASGLSKTVLEESLEYEATLNFMTLPNIIDLSSLQLRHHSQWQATFFEIWSEISIRDTTQSDDLHSILAVLLNLSAKEIISLPLDLRTKAIFRAQPALPLSMLFHSWPDGTLVSTACPWVPLFPSGHMDDRYGNMYWTPDGNGLEFVPSALGCTFLATEILHQQSLNFIVRLKSSDGSVYISTLWLGDPWSNLSTHIGRLYILLHCFDAKRSPETGSAQQNGVGGWFLPCDRSSDQTHVVYLQWGGMLAWRSLPDVGPTEEPQPDSAVLLAEVMPFETECIIPCGKSWFILRPHIS